MKVNCEIKPPIAVITIDQPEARNALSADVRDALCARLADLKRADDVHGVILRGAGEHFCAGGDIRTMGETNREAIKARMSDVGRAALTVGNFPKPLIAAIRGHAAGAGVSLACLCDWVVADTSAAFTLAFLKIGLGPDWGLSHTLSLRVGSTVAKRLILGRERVDANEAYRIGLVDTLVEPSALDETAHAVAIALAEAPSGGVSAVKDLLSDNDALERALEHEARMQTERFLSAEHQEGVAAFREKRAPKFHAR